MGDDPIEGRPQEVLLVPPPVRTRPLRPRRPRTHRVDLGLPPAQPPAAEPWIETDALSTPAPRPPRDTPERPTRSEPGSFVDIPVPDSTDEVYQPPSIPDDPLTLSNSDTVPLFGLAPERVADPSHPTPTPAPRVSAPQWPWFVAVAILLLGVLLSIALIVL